ncbi:nuclear transport factor 2-like isoform X2 [Lycium ferocissimum]|uniref:nuclear transport factor 2-like isoform X2 n=1 Tax=Lycium ferocissimum TaxID=112874 RepID=UPI002815AB83|nr:nuclear transport factor 2-like isoform X2 [Lycium ferocissimum]
MAAAVEAAAAAQQPVSAQVVGNAFVQQYYHILHHSPGLVFRFYQDISKLGRPEDDGSMSITTTMQAINDKILSLNYADFRAEIKSVDSQESFKGGVHVLVTGYLTGKDNLIRNFSQTFFLAPQDRGYFVLNDIFRYVEIVNQQDTVQVPETDVVLAPVTPEQIVADPPNPLPAQEDHISEQSTPSAEEANGGEVYNPPENANVPVVEEEVPVPEVVDEVQGDSQVVAESNIVIEQVPKMSYASIVRHLKESAATFSPPPAPAPRKIVPKSVEQVSQPPAAVPADSSVLSSDFVDNGNNQEGEADGYSVYIKGLPMSATPAMLEDEFKKFGPIKNGGIQVRSNRQQGFTFGFVEFEEATAVQKAIEASPILIGGRQAAVEEKKSTNSRGNTRGRYPSGRGGSGFRNDGGRGRGNYGGGGRGYNRGGDFNGRSEFNNRGGNRGGSSNRGGDGYQRADNMGGNNGRMNRGGGMPNGTAKNMTPRISATA